MKTEINRLEECHQHFQFRSHLMASMSSGSLTEEQRKRIEENRRKALEKRAALLNQREQQKLTNTSSSSATSVRAATFRSETDKTTVSNDVPPTRKEHALLSLSTGNTIVPQRQLSLQCGGAKPTTTPLSIAGQASNTHIHAKPSLTGSIARPQNSAAAATSKKSSVGPSSVNSFQSTLSQFCRPQINPSSSTRKYPSSTTNGVSVNDKPRALKIGSSSTLNCRKPEKEVKGNCVLISRERFTVVVPFQAQLIGIFKTMPSKRYGKVHDVIYVDSGNHCCYKHCQFVYIHPLCNQIGGFINAAAVAENVRSLLQKHFLSYIQDVPVNVNPPSPGLGGNLGFAVSKSKKMSSPLPWGDVLDPMSLPLECSNGKKGFRLTTEE